MKEWVYDLDMLANVSEQTEQKGRNVYIDILKGIGILLMIMGHIGFGGKFSHYIHAFHMPLFFFISGFLYKHKADIKFREIVMKKVKTLIIPYIIFGFFHYLIYILINYNENDFINPLKHLLFMNSDGMPIAGSLWFLTALFFTEIIYEVLYRKVKNRYIFIAIIVTLSVIGTILPDRLPYSIDISMVGIGIFFIGRCFAANRRLLKELNNKNIIRIILLFIANGIFIFINGYINMRKAEYSIIPIFWINAIMGTIIYWNISYFLSNIKTTKKLNNILSFIGQNSIVFLCLNELTIKLIKMLIHIEGNIVIKVGSKVFIFVATIIILSSVTLIINKTKLKKIIGK